MAKSTLYYDTLFACDKFCKRREKSEKQIASVKEEFDKRFSKFDDLKAKFTCFCAGSLAREDSGHQSDLDLFAMSKKKLPKLQRLRVLSSMVDANDSLHYPQLSNDGEFLEVHNFKLMQKNLGSRKDDFSNQFTTRMLLLLESKPLYNEKLYNYFLKETVSLYDRDHENHRREFLPLYLMNDLLRFWRTLCLNYEVIRTEEKPWRKKNINLKFSRMLTVYSAIIPAAFHANITESDWICYLNKSPLERIAMALDEHADDQFEGSFRDFVDIYQEFLEWKEVEVDDIDEFLAEPGRRAAQKRKANDFSKFLYTLLSSEFVSPNIKRYLVI